jgi:threonine synthase
MVVKYRSTRGNVNGASFENVVLGGLAPDRGLYVPDHIPTFRPEEVWNLWLHYFLRDHSLDKHAPL